jgi:hypothetical protein
LWYQIIKFIQDGKYSLHKADTRHADHGWIQAKALSFSFVVGTILTEYIWRTRVLNDDVIGEGMGFGTPPRQYGKSSNPSRRRFSSQRHGKCSHNQKW